MGDPNQSFQAWQSQPSPKSMNGVLDSLKPDMDRAIMSSGGSPSPLTRGMAKRVVVDAMHSYKPTEGTQFRSWTQTQLKRLTRPMRQTKFTTRIPDARAQDAIKVRNASAEMEAETGFEPSESQLADHLGIPRKKIRSLMSGGGSPETMAGEEETQPVDEKEEMSELVRDMVYTSLAPRDQTIMEYMTGHNGVKQLPSVDIARKLNISPAAVSQRGAKITRMLQEAQGIL